MSSDDTYTTMTMPATFNLLAEFNGENHSELARKYRLTTRRVYLIIKNAQNASAGDESALTQLFPDLAPPIDPFRRFFKLLVTAVGMEKAQTLITDMEGATISFPINPTSRVIALIARINTGLLTATEAMDMCRETLAIRFGENQDHPVLCKVSSDLTVEIDGFKHDISHLPDAVVGSDMLIRPSQLRTPVAGFNPESTPAGEHLTVVEAAANLRQLMGDMQSMAARFETLLTGTGKNLENCHE